MPLMEQNALVIFDTVHDDTFLIEPAAPAGPDRAGAGQSTGIDPRAVAVLSAILASHGLRVVLRGAVAQDAAAQGYGSTGAALVAALVIFERFAARQFADSPAVLARAETAAAIYRRDILSRTSQIDAALPLGSLIWDRENGLTRQEMARLGGSGRTAVALRVILTTLPRALALMAPAERARGMMAFRVLSEVWDILADDICAAAEGPRPVVRPRRA
jgi:hypothetical protein